MPTASPSARVRSARHGRRTAVLASMVAIALVVTGCSRGSGDDSAAQISTFDTPVTIDNCGHIETFDAAPQRIVSMDHNSTETLIQMGVADRIVGMGFADNADPASDSYREWESIPALSDGTPSAETVLDLEPDLVVGLLRAGFDEKKGLSRDRLNSQGIGTFMFTDRCGEGFDDLDVLVDDFTVLGDVLGVPDDARALVDRVTGAVDAVGQKLAQADATPVRTFFYDSGEDQPMTFGGTGGGNLIARLAGAENITPEGDTGFFATSWEVVGERAPEAIVIVDYGTTSAEDKIAFLKNHPVAQTTPAVQNDRFVVAPLNAFYESPLIVAAVETIAHGLHPEAFDGD